MSNKYSTKVELISNLSITVLANLVSLFSSLTLTFLLPKFIGVDQYGYYQLYIFYTSFIGFLGLGWHEGVYLRLGGAYYDEINKPLYKSQLMYYSLMEVLIGFLICIYGLVCGSLLEKKLIFFMVGICIIVYLPRAFLHNILQATNNVKAHSKGIIIEKSVHIITTLALLIFGNNVFIAFVISELIGRGCGAAYIFVVCKDIIKSKSTKLKELIRDIKQNIQTGIKLMLANVASLLIIGVVRQAIEIHWDVETFSKVSLALSVSNLLMIFVRAVSTTLFPIFRRTSLDKLNGIYTLMRNILVIPLIGLMMFCYPIQVLLSLWLPHYADSLKYLTLLFPICIFESKSSMLIETFLKTMRREKQLLYINAVTVSLSLIFTSICVFYYNNLDAAVFSIVVLVVFRSVLGELILARISELRVTKNIINELIMTIFFIILSWGIGGWKGCIVYISVYVIYLLINRKEINGTINTIKERVLRKIN